MLGFSSPRCTCKYKYPPLLNALLSFWDQGLQVECPRSVLGEVCSVDRCLSELFAEALQWDTCGNWEKSSELRPPQWLDIAAPSEKWSDDGLRGYWVGWVMSLCGGTLQVDWNPITPWQAGPNTQQANQSFTLDRLKSTVLDQNGGCKHPGSSSSINPQRGEHRTVIKSQTWLKSQFCPLFVLRPLANH